MSAGMALGIYLHVPFCRTRCHFCAFYLRIHREDWVLAYLQALRREIDLHATRRTLEERRPATLYLGGGTPTTLQPEQLADAIALIGSHFRLHPEAEITVEAHPETVTPESLKTLRSGGVNRISFGVQSMAEEELVTIGRRPAGTGGTTIARTVAAARAAGFDNLNLDLIYGLPGQSLDTWRETLDAAVALEPAHLSCYALTVEEKTHLHVALGRGESLDPDQDLQNLMDDAAAERLARAGFTRYEISNYCRPGFACRHNLLHWQNGEYLGLGPSAQSYVNGCRFGNVEDVLRYQDLLGAGRLPIAQEERLDPGQRQREALAFGLRLTEGVSLVPAAPLSPQLDERLRRLAGQGLLERADGRVKLTSLGRRFADRVAVELL